MREILFRGKRKDSGWWEVGDHSTYTTSDGICRSFINGTEYEVYPETVGQYTGLVDKNGTKIFEGDIVRYNTSYDFDCYSVVKFGEYKQDGSDGEYKPCQIVGWYVEVDSFTCPDWAENDPSCFPKHLKQQNLNEVACFCEVIGNIHDNKEPLEGGQ